MPCKIFISTLSHIPCNIKYTISPYLNESPTVIVLVSQATPAPDQMSQSSVELQEESVYENASVLMPASVPLIVDDLGLHIQTLQMQEDGFQNEFDVIHLTLLFRFDT